MYTPKYSFTLFKQIFIPIAPNLQLLGSKTAKELSGNAAPGSCMEDSQKENYRIYNYVMHYLNKLKAALYGKEWN